MAAIYQWFVADVQILTTTLYPIEDSEGLKFSIDVSGGGMYEIDTDAWSMAGDYVSAYITPILLTGPTEDDAWSMAGQYGSAFITPILLTGPTEDDAWSMIGGYVSAAIDDKLITAYFPDQGIVFAIDVDSEYCSMTDV